MDETIGSIVKYNRANDIVFKLKAKEGGATFDGLVDKRIFTGENNLHAIMDKQTCLWHLTYDNGTLPAQLKGQYTGFNKLFDTVRVYYGKRNIEITETIDAEESSTSN